MFYNLFLEEEIKKLFDRKFLYIILIILQEIIH